MSSAHPLRIVTHRFSQTNISASWPLYSASWQHLPNGDSKNSQCLVFPFKYRMIILQYFPETTENTPKLVSWLTSYIHSLEECHWYYSWGLAKVQNIIVQAHLWTRYKRHNIFLKKLPLPRCAGRNIWNWGDILGGMEIYCNRKFLKSMKVILKRTPSKWGIWSLKWQCFIAR